MIRLSKRLQAVADLLTAPVFGDPAEGAADRGRAACGKEPVYDCIADVGTDHGYLPIYLIEQELCKKVIAMDINRGPLQRAQEHIREHQLGAYIETRLSDGVKALQKGEAQAIVIAGMGGNTMREILKDGTRVIEPDTVLILQPQSEIEEFRSYLVSHGFSFVTEDMVLEDGKYYPMMKVQKRQADRTYSETELRYGPLLLAQRHPVLREFLLWQQEQKNRILEALRQQERKNGILEELRQADAPVCQNPRQEETFRSGSAQQADIFLCEKLRQEEASRRRSRRMAQLEDELGYIRQALSQYEDVEGQ